jgi:hypothetical protein
MRDFGSWFAEQGKEEPETHFWLKCRGCGKEELVERKAYENGDVAWYSEDEESGEGVCGGSQFCCP